MPTARARARSNMALVKYWGKRDDELVLPFTGSLSMTLDALVDGERSHVHRRARARYLLLDGEPAQPGEVRRVTALLDLVRAQASGLGAAQVESRNSFPTAGGLASSASGFAALAAAAAWAGGIDADAAALSILARRASGSACRSVLGGFVEWVRGRVRGRRGLRRSADPAGGRMGRGDGHRHRRRRAEGEELARRHEAERPHVALLRGVGPDHEAGSRRGPAGGRRLGPRARGQHRRAVVPEDARRRR